MNGFTFSTDAAGVDAHELARIKQKITPELERMRSSFAAGYDSPYAFLHVPHDAELLARVSTLADKLLSQELGMVIVVGIGGSHLGSLALAQALYGKNFYQRTKEPHLYFSDTLDSAYTSFLIQRADVVLRQGKKIAVNVISKSGTTTETMINAAPWLALLRRHYGELAWQYFVFTSDHGSPLYQLAIRHEVPFLEIPTQLGGRYSVFSAVGLLPLALLGVDIRELQKGARRVTEAALFSEDSWSATSAAILYYHLNHGVAIHDTFLFNTKLEACGLWYRQLMGESIGKKENLENIAIEAGMTPTVSVGTNDLHSVAQLYLAGPRDKITTFVWAENSVEDSPLLVNDFSEKFAATTVTTLNQLKWAVFQGVVAAYAHEKRPYMLVAFDDITPELLGVFMQGKMIEIVLLASLLSINPFDQPAVELYKKYTRALLAP